MTADSYRFLLSHAHHCHHHHGKGVIWAQVEKLGKHKIHGELGNDITGVSITLLLSSDLNGPRETNNFASIGRLLDPCLLSFFNLHVLLLGNM